MALIIKSITGNAAISNSFFPTEREAGEQVLHHNHSRFRLVLPGNATTKKPNFNCCKSQNSSCGATLVSAHPRRPLRCRSNRINVGRLMPLSCCCPSADAELSKALQPAKCMVMVIHVLPGTLHPRPSLARPVFNSQTSCHDRRGHWT
jgi:hypothetical protein